MNERRRYPDPPWETHGFGVFCPYVVPVRTVRLPEGLEPVHAAGMATGLLAYVRYEPPSPLTYDEMIWMPCLVRHRAADGRRLRGYWVARMWVDSEASLEGGRAIWALPKTLARFERSERGVVMHGEHGTEIVLDWRRLGLAAPVRGRVTTLQTEGDRIVRFTARARARAAMGRLRVRRLSSSDPELRSLDRAHPLGGFATVLDPFDSSMLAPSIHPRRRDGVNRTFG